MKINSEKLRSRAKQADVSRDDLAAAIVRPGLDLASARSAVGNWMRGSDHPRPKPEDIAKLAGSLGCEGKDLVRFVSVAKHVRSSPRKSRLLVDLIRGKRVDEAMNLLTFNKRRASMFVERSLKAAIADAENFDADVSRLVVTECRVDEGVTIKRFQPKDRGRAHPIQKKTSHIVVGVEEAG